MDQGAGVGLAPLAKAPVGRIALIGETLVDVRQVMIKGVSGLLAIHRADERPRFEASMTWPNGAIAQMFSADDPDSLRGPQFEVAWADELAKWRAPERTWDMLQFALRLGSLPRAVVTTTPRPIPLLKTLLADAFTVVSHAPTKANAANLARSFIAEMERRYGDSALGRQELMGEVIEERAGSLWRRQWIDAPRIRHAPPLASIVVAVDPPITATASSDACGIVIAGVGEDGRGYVMADRTVQGRQPQVWARAVIAAYRDFQADHVVAEVNQGGDLVVQVLKQFEASLPIRTVRATRGKWLRAEPVAALYAEGRVIHARHFPRAGGPDVQFRRRWPLQRPQPRPSRRLGVGPDRPHARHRRTRAVKVVNTTLPSVGVIPHHPRRVRSACDVGEHPWVNARARSRAAQRVEP